MALDTALTLLVSMLTLAYLLVALLRPEKF